MKRKATLVCRLLYAAAVVAAIYWLAATGVIPEIVRFWDRYDGVRPLIVILGGSMAGVVVWLGYTVFFGYLD